MKRLFCDTSYFVALLNPRDQWHAAATKMEPLVEQTDLVTTEEVLVECLNLYSESGKHVRLEVSLYVRQLLLNPKFHIIARNEVSFLNALDLYESRLDKGYRLTDCNSMNVCRELGIKDVLTSDRHFDQEGFSVLL